MTTRVTVDARAGWPVAVTLVDLATDEETTVVVPAGEVREFHIHDERSLRCAELPRAATPA